MEDKKVYTVLIRTVKCLDEDKRPHTVIIEKGIIARDREEVKSIMYEKYLELFQNGKLYYKETKDDAQFFYLQAFEIDGYEQKLIERGQWTCHGCGRIHANRYMVTPYTNKRCASMEFCSHACFEVKSADLLLSHGGDVMLDDAQYINEQSSIYIYRISNKHNGKSYVGKTKNMPFFRWWNHYKRNYTKFGETLRNTSLADWNFEILEVLDPKTSNSEVLLKESEYIIQFDSINNGYNSVISNKEAYVGIDDDENSDNLM